MSREVGNFYTFRIEGQTGLALSGEPGRNCADLIGGEVNLLDLRRDDRDIAIWVEHANMREEEFPHGVHCEVETISSSNCEPSGFVHDDPEAGCTAPGCKLHQLDPCSPSA